MRSFRWHSGHAHQSLGRQRGARLTTLCRPTSVTLWQPISRRTCLV